jgi:hypothetical protein
MFRMTMVPLVAVLALAAGCSEPSAAPSAAPPAGPSAAPSATPSATPSASPSVDDAATIKAICREVNTAAVAQAITAALAIGGKEPDAAMRGKVSQSYRNFGSGLRLLAWPDAPNRLIAPLLDWAEASSDVAAYVAGTKPPKGIVLDLGPANTRWRAAKTRTEKVCGFELGRPGGGPSNGP